MCRWAKVPDVAITWHVEHGPWFDNGVMTSSSPVDQLVSDSTTPGQTDGRQTLTNTLDVELQTERPTADHDGAATATV